MKPFEEQRHTLDSCLPGVMKSTGLEFGLWFITSRFFFLFRKAEVELQSNKTISAVCKVILISLYIKCSIVRKKIQSVMWFGMTEVEMDERKWETKMAPNLFLKCFKFKRIPL